MAKRLKIVNVDTHVATNLLDGFQYVVDPGIPDVPAVPGYDYGTGLFSEHFDSDPTGNWNDYGPAVPDTGIQDNHVVQNGAIYAKPIKNVDQRHVHGLDYQNSTFGPPPGQPGGIYKLYIGNYIQKGQYSDDGWYEYHNRSYTIQDLLVRMTLFSYEYIVTGVGTGYFYPGLVKARLGFSIIRNSVEVFYMELTSANQTVAQNSQGEYIVLPGVDQAISNVDIRVGDKTRITVLELLETTTEVYMDSDAGGAFIHVPDFVYFFASIFQYVQTASFKQAVPQASLPPHFRMGYKCTLGEGTNGEADEVSQAFFPIYNPGGPAIHNAIDAAYQGNQSATTGPETLFSEENAVAHLSVVKNGEETLCGVLITNTYIRPYTLQGLDFAQHNVNLASQSAWWFTLEYNSVGGSFKCAIWDSEPPAAGGTPVFEFTENSYSPVMGTTNIPMFSGFVAVRSDDVPSTIALAETHYDNFFVVELHHVDEIPAVPGVAATIITDPIPSYPQWEQDNLGRIVFFGDVQNGGSWIINPDGSAPRPLMPGQIVKTPGARLPNVWNASQHGRPIWTPESGIVLVGMSADASQPPSSPAGSLTPVRGIWMVTDTGEVLELLIADTVDTTCIYADWIPGES